ncbi:hypothetical protein A2617_02610 [Candidatus Daviesbacteria bacterium RIFOXYD1_FULL_41_10]|uniref:Uncharacterized protein n=2 Tax=Candidatus Daviesiibacteriota TaxID=1752718 RepID=A0A1F5MZD8_9BACT|nr:MAG: hypothetical protein UU67_C0057G0004 [Candidatus Daviesbacteria bacterium GW2011_GWB1_41_5]OGE70683.1 MAG: hypothetical protein A2617_02610 [Candidatus Daviesbacteria bacterium RIFOXYD1_FULL_41_10]
MEHAVPQNVTSFEFHLVGDMTLKQFAYLGSGLGIAFLVYSTLFQTLPYVAAPIIVISALSGVALAFLPVLDRPLDHFVLAFFKAIYSPTKGEVKLPPGTNRLQLFLKPAQPAPDKPQQTPKIVPVNPGLTPISPIPDQGKKIIELLQQNAVLQKKLLEVEQNLQTLKQTTSIPRPPLPASPPAGGPVPTPIYPKPPKAVVVEPVKPVKTQMLLTSFPNVINGVVEEDGDFLEGVIVIIHNKDNIPVRALKTNKLGQFSGATPLPSGVYTVTLEKEDYKFDTLQITLTGEILSPLKLKPRK